MFKASKSLCIKGDYSIINGELKCICHYHLGKVSRRNKSVFNLTGVRLVELTKRERYIPNCRFYSIRDLDIDENEELIKELIKSNESFEFYCDNKDENHVKFCHLKSPSISIVQYEEVLVEADSEMTPMIDNTYIQLDHSNITAYPIEFASTHETYEKVDGANQGILPIGNPVFDNARANDNEGNESTIRYGLGGRGKPFHSAAYADKPLPSNTIIDFDVLNEYINTFEDIGEFDMSELEDLED